MSYIFYILTLFGTGVIAHYYDERKERMNPRDKSNSIYFIDQYNKEEKERNSKKQL